jgi:hypothetical protein
MKTVLTSGGKPAKRFCVNGHDTYECDRDNTGRCILCSRASSRARERPRTSWPRQNSMNEPRLAWLPLRDALASHGLDLKIDGTVRRRWAARGIPLSVADHLCCTLLLMHPFEVYGDDWWAVA